jgi:hypothetical protein
VWQYGQSWGSGRQAAVRLAANAMHERCRTTERHEMRRLAVAAVKQVRLRIAATIDPPIEHRIRSASLQQPSHAAQLTEPKYLRRNGETTVSAHNDGSLRLPSREYSSE